MKKILYIVSSLSATGPTNQLYQLILHLNKTKFSVCILTLSPEQHDTCRSDFEKAGAEVYTLGLSRIEGVLTGRRKVKMFICEVKPDLIHTQGIRADLISSSLDVKMPRISTIHNFPQLDYVMTYGRLKGKFMSWLQGRAVRKLSHCIGVSKAVSKNMSLYYGVNIITPILNGVDNDVFFPLEDEGGKKEKKKRELQLPEKSRIWISVGHLNDRKKPQDLARAFASLFTDSKDDFLIFLGGGDLKGILEEEFKGNNNIIFLGMVNNIVDYLQVGDFFCSSSSAEGLPMSAIEAMACGLPVLLSDIEPHQEIFSLNDNVGISYPLGEHNALVLGFRNMIKKNRKSMTLSCLKVTSELLSAKVMAEQYQSKYLEILKK